MKFIAYTICAANNAKPSSYIPYGPTNKNAKPDPAKAYRPLVSAIDGDGNAISVRLVARRGHARAATEARG